MHKEYYRVGTIYTTAISPNKCCNKGNNTKVTLNTNCSIYRKVNLASSHDVI